MRILLSILLLLCVNTAFAITEDSNIISLEKGKALSKQRKLPTVIPITFNCPEDKPLKKSQPIDINVICLPCDTLDRYVKDTDCEKVCPNRMLWKGGLCALKECPSNAPLRQDNGACWPCDVSDRGLSLEKPEDCEKVCPNRMLWKSDSKFYNNTCVLKDCPKGTIRMKTGDCSPCQDFIENSSTVYPENPKDCSRCAELIPWGEECVAKECPGNWRNERGRCACEDIDPLFPVDDPNECIICGYKPVANWNKTEWSCEKEEGKDSSSVYLKQS